jgi:superfamily II DNA/RNA helicase
MKMYPTLTKIQKKTISITLAGHDVIGVAKIGCGKTLAYALPMLLKIRE